MSCGCAWRGSGLVFRGLTVLKQCIAPKDPIQIRALLEGGEHFWGLPKVRSANTSGAHFNRPDTPFDDVLQSVPASLSSTEIAEAMMAAAAKGKKKKKKGGAKKKK